MNLFRLLILLSFLWLQACSTLPDAINPKNDNALNTSAAKQHRIFIASHGWHTGIIIPAKKAETVFPFLKQRFPSTLYYEFGWGDRGFYQANEVTSGLTLQAILWPSESVMHIVSVPSSPEKYFSASEVIELLLSGTELENLLLFIESSFYKDISNNIINIKRGLYGDSQFYEGMGDYHLFNTCNKWVAKGLKSAGYEISPTFKLTAESIMSYLKRMNHAGRNPLPASSDPLFLY